MKRHKKSEKSDKEDDYEITKEIIADYTPVEKKPVIAMKIEMNGEAEIHFFADIKIKLPGNEAIKIYKLLISIVENLYGLHDLQKLRGD